MSTIYCPACGDVTSRVALLTDITPGHQEDWRCPKCGTLFTLTVTYMEKEAAT